MLISIQQGHCQIASKTDSLEKVISQTTGRDQIDALNQLALLYARVNYEKSKEYFTTAQDKSRQLNYCHGWAKALQVQALAVFFTNDHKGYIELNEQSAKKALECQDWQLACDSYESIAYTYVTLWQDYFESLEYYHKSLELYEQHFPEGNVYKPTLGIAKVYIIQNDFDRAYEYLQKAKTLVKDNDEAALQILYENEGDFAFAKGRYDEAEIFFQKALASYKKSNAIGGMIFCYTDLANVYRETKNYEAALKYGQEALKLGENYKQYDRARLYGSESLGRTYLATSDFKKAKEYFLETVTIAGKFNMIAELKDGYKALAKISEATNNYKEALHYQQLHTAFSDSVMNKTKARRISRLEVQLETAKREKEIEILKRDKKLTQSNMAAIIATLCGLIVLAISIIGRQRINHRKQKELAAMEQRMLKEHAEKIETELKNEKLHEEQLAKELDFKTKELTTSALHLIQKNEILVNLKESVEELKKLPKDQVQSKLGGLINTVNFSFNLDSDWTSFRLHFDSVHQGFFDRLLQVHPDLTGNDLKICALMRLNLGTKEMATILDISPDSVKVARHRIRKKLNIPTEQNLSSYLASF